jgi:hypothetical protein
MFFIIMVVARPCAIYRHFPDSFPARVGEISVPYHALLDNFD